jgi:endonuclease V-like protein UPF0215 family
MKQGIRALGVDDSPFVRTQKRVLVVGAIYRDDVLEGVLSTHVERDGFDATENIAAMVKKSKFCRQLHAVFLNGIMLAGFNVVDIKRLSNALRIPVIAVVRRKPDMDAVKKALSNLPGYGRKLHLLENDVRKFGSTYLQTAGAPHERAHALAAHFSTHGNIPEPLRIAHMIAGGIVRGASHGRA